MFGAHFGHDDHVTKSVGAAFVCALSKQYLYSGEAELCSEVICWLVLPVLLKTSIRNDIETIPIPTCSSKTRRHLDASSSYTTWLVAILILAACLGQAELGVVGYLVRRSSSRAKTSEGC